MAQEMIENLKLYAIDQSFPSDELYQYLNTACQLKASGELEAVYKIYIKIYEKQLLEYNKDLDGSYEEHIIEKVNFLTELATLNLMFTGNLQKSIQYIDETLDLLDAHESVAPYVDCNSIKKKKRDYMQLLLTII